MKVTVIDKIDLSPAMQKIQSKDFWLYGAKEWQRILYDYIPHDSNRLRQDVTYRPKEIEYRSPYSRFIYYGLRMDDPKYHKGGFTADGGITWFSRPGVRKIRTTVPLLMKNGSKEWDKKAIQEKKDELLVKSMQKWIDRYI